MVESWLHLHQQIPYTICLCSDTLRASPRVPFGREAILNYEPTEHSEQFANFPEVDSAFDKINCPELGADVRPPNRSAVYQLAIDTKRRLALIELKDASAAAHTVYCAPFQLLRYVWEWHSALEAVRAERAAPHPARQSCIITPTRLTPFRRITCSNSTARGIWRRES